MKSLLYVLFSVVAFISTPSVNAEPCDKVIFRNICNPELNIVEKCYDCHRLDNQRERCFPAFNKLDLTNFLSTKKWNCTVHEWRNPFVLDELNSVSDEEY